MNSDDRKIIICTDRKIGGALGSSETMLKSRSLGAASWRCLTAGTDSDILCAVRLLKNGFVATEHIDETNALSIVRDALAQRKNEKASELIQGKFGISYAD